MVNLDRRSFLRVVGVVGSSAVASGCTNTAKRLIPYVLPPEDIIPGAPTWYATTCRECPAGCGMLVKNRDGHVIKVEGNPRQPVSGGALCARGHASLQGLYNPDRFPGPLRKNLAGVFEPIDWESAEGLFVQRVQEMAAKGRGERIVFLTDIMNGSSRDLLVQWLTALGAPKAHIVYEPLAYEALRKANQVVFGQDAIPTYRIDRADFLISFNAGFLETWLSNIEYARQYGEFHAIKETGKHPFVFVGPRLSMTAANADLWIPVAPGDEFLVGLGILRVITDEGLMPALPAAQTDALTASLGSWTLEAIAARTGVAIDLLRGVARMFAQVQRPLALAEGLSLTEPNAVESAVAANLLNSLAPGSAETIDFGAPSVYSSAAPLSAIKALSDRMASGDVDLLCVYRCNPAFTLPTSWQFADRLKSVPMVVSFSSAGDETATFAHLVLPSNSPLESWDDYSPRPGVTGFLQPVMGNLFDSRPFGDILITTGKKVAGADRFPWKDSYEFLQEAWMAKQTAPNQDFESFWEQAVERGGLWEEPMPAAPLAASTHLPYPFPGPETLGKPASPFAFTAYPTVQFFDGREANKPWIQELPDPITQTTWGAWVEIHPETARAEGIEKGDMLRLKSPFGVLEAPALPIMTVPKGTLAMPIGQGHTAFGRFAEGLPANPIQLLAPDIDAPSGGLLRPAFGVSVEKLDRQFAIAHTDGSFTDHGRELMEVMTLTEYKGALNSGYKPPIELPLPEGYDAHRDFYPPHTHVDYRWAMVVDLDRCIGCGACVLGCYSENNVALVFRDQVLKGREMSWIRAQRYFDPGKPVAHWLVMLCQHCDNAPCESVCPIFAPHHSKEGLNNQVYNRCFGTRFCLQNDPYKVRRFNWFTWTRPEPLNWQLNPDVTVRQKGVMEKCSFCIQRIIEAKIQARNAGRKVQDGDFTTACAQTCPTGVITFGNLKDPNSRVSRMVNDTRAYQVLSHLNTKPAVIYLKRIRMEIPTVSA